MSISIAWPDRGRAISPPSSALSARIVIKKAAADGSNIEFVANRDENRASHLQTYTSPTAGLPGERTVETHFFSSRDGAGSEVGGATFDTLIGSNGAINTSIAIDTKIASVEVAEEQHVWVHKPKQLVATAFDGQHNAVVIGADALRWTVTEGLTALKIENGLADGTVQGTASVTAAVDGLTSPAVQVEVRPTAAVAHVSASRMSADGSTFLQIGNSTSARWTLAGGTQPLVDSSSSETYRRATDLNVDGSVVVGFCSTSVNAVKHAWIWRNGAWEYPIAGAATIDAVSRNALHFAGTLNPNSNPRAFYMDVTNSVQQLALSEGATSSTANLISDDGLVIAGEQKYEVGNIATVWINGVPHLVTTPSGSYNCHLTAMSGDGQTLIGYYDTGTGLDMVTTSFRWTLAEGVGQPLPDGSGGPTFRLTDMTGSGAMFLGGLRNHPNTAYVWSATDGYEKVSKVLLKKYGLDLSTWPSYTQKLGYISDDGGTFYGNSTYIYPVATD